MSRAFKLTQLVFTLPDQVGLLDKVTSAISAENVNIKAICAYGMEGEANFMLVTDDNAKTKEALAKIDIEVMEEAVAAVELEDRPGELQKVARKIAEAGINIVYMYGTAAGADKAICIFKTLEIDKTIEVINE
jgi:hypothetical protein